MSNYIGIDYGHGMSNIDPETGIRYGVINMNALNEWVWEEFEADYGEPTCEDCGDPAVEFNGEKHGKYEMGSGCSDYACEHCKRVFDSSDAYGLALPIGYYLDNETYRVTVDSHGDAMILKSPYYTHAQFCSPCAPGAGHLEHPVEGGPKTYCFDKTWFQNDIAPYPVYSVETDELVN